MSIKGNKWVWTKQKEEAVVLLAEDELTDPEIAQRIGISHRQLARWKVFPEFSERVEKFAARLAGPARDRAIAKKARRVRVLDEVWAKLQTVLEERGAAPEMQDVAGGKTGLLVRKIKGIGFGDNAQVVEEFEVDTALLKEMRETAKQAAQELGQWVDKGEQTISGIPGTVLNIPDNERDKPQQVDDHGGENESGGEAETGGAEGTAIDLS